MSKIHVRSLNSYRILRTVTAVRKVEFTVTEYSRACQLRSLRRLAYIFCPHGMRSTAVTRTCGLHVGRAAPARGRFCKFHFLLSFRTFPFLSKSLAFPAAAAPPRLASALSPVRLSHVRVELSWEKESVGVAAPHNRLPRLREESEALRL